MCGGGLCGCLQNEDLTPKNEDYFFLQACQTRDSQTGSTLFLRHQMMRNQWGLRFVSHPSCNFHEILREQVVGDVLSLVAWNFVFTIFSCLSRVAISESFQYIPEI